MKAALLSALVFPGAGHLYLRRYTTAGILAVAALSGMYFIVVGIATRAFAITEQIRSGEIPLDPVVIAELLAKQSTGSDTQQLNLSMAVFVIAWLVGVIDSYRKG